MNKHVVALPLLLFPGLAIAHGPVNEIVGSFSFLLLFHVAGMCLAVLFGWRISLLIHVAATALVVPLYVGCFLWLMRFFESSSVVIADTATNKIIYYLLFYFFTLVVPFIVSRRISRFIEEKRKH